MAPSPGALRAFSLVTRFAAIRHRGRQSNQRTPICPLLRRSRTLSMTNGALLGPQLRVQNWSLRFLVLFCVAVGRMFISKNPTVRGSSRLLFSARTRSGIARFFFCGAFRFHACQSNSSSSRDIHHLLHVKPLCPLYLQNSPLVSVVTNLAGLVFPTRRQE
jgi:hypothetical protein